MPVVSYSCVQGGYAGTGNIDDNPLLTPDGHLRSISPCIDAGDNALIPNDMADLDADGDTGEPVPFDIDDYSDWHDDRVANGQVDMGADEFIDTEQVPSDGLPDWWVNMYPAADNPGYDYDLDGLNNLAEYEEYSSNPTASPYYVFVPLTIQDGLDMAADGDTVLVFPGSYTGFRNYELDYGGKPVVVRTDIGGPSIIDCGFMGRAVNTDSVNGTFAVLEGFVIQNGVADYGGGISTDQSRFMLKDCELDSNIASIEGGGIYSNLASPILDNLTIGTNNTAPGGLISSSNVTLRDVLSLPNGAGTLESRSSWFHGPMGEGVITEGIKLHPGSSPANRTTFKVAGDTPGDPPTVIRTNITGPDGVTGAGDIEIDADQMLIIDKNAIVDLDRQTGDDCENAVGGRIIVNGTLLVRDTATVRNTSTCIYEAQIDGDDITIQNNNIILLEACKGFGGQFYVKDSVSIIDNYIFSEGDRYLDLDPDPDNPNLNISGNTIEVLIKPGVPEDQGTLLEMRGHDYDYNCDPEDLDTCVGAFQLSSSDGYSSENWVLETLTIAADAKVNLTNRQGFQFQGDATHPEVIYVKNLVLEPGAVLNTGYQRLYYQNLVGDPNQIVNVPLLGFSLAIIAMNDDIEFDVRVQKRITDPDDFDPVHPNDPLPQGSLLRLANERGPGDGVMEMKTQAIGQNESAGSVAAKGHFARAAEDEVSVVFEYLFDQNPDPQAELVVYLSEDPDVSENIYPVAIIDPPPAGYPGSDGSNTFAVFSAKFPREKLGEYSLNFTHGTYIELELRGTNARLLIDNWDPRIECNEEGTCGDLNYFDDVTWEDYLLLVASYGEELGPPNPYGETSLWCLDINGDKYVGLEDLLAWDRLITIGETMCLARALTGLSISGPDIVTEGQTEQYQGFATYDYTDTEPVMTDWSIESSNPDPGYIDGDGNYTAPSPVTGCIDVTINTEYWDGVTKTSSKAIQVEEAGSGACGGAGAPLEAQSVLSGNHVLVAGKQNVSAQHDFIYQLKRSSIQLDNGETTFDSSLCTDNNPGPPGAGSQTYANGRMIMDRMGYFYQVPGKRGPIEPGDPPSGIGTGGVIMLNALDTDDDDEAVIKPIADAPKNPALGNITISVGLTTSIEGIPLDDAVFDPLDSKVLYVVPVLVTVPQAGEIPEHTYRAAAKLQLPAVIDGTFTVEMLYGMDPIDDPCVTTDPPEASPCNVQGIREIEIDENGNLFVLSAKAFNNNDWILVYNKYTGCERRLQLCPASIGGISLEVAYPESPTGMAVLGDGLYLTSSAITVQSETSTRIFRYAIVPGSTGCGDVANLTTPEFLDITNPIVANPCNSNPMVAQIVALEPNPLDQSLWALGFVAPTFGEDEDPNEQCSPPSQLFTTPMLAVIPEDAVWTTTPVTPTLTAGAFSCHDLTLPMSMTFPPRLPADFDWDGDVDSNDYSYFEMCVTGPTVLQSNPDCLWPNPSADFDRDNDMDQKDFGMFQRCYSGDNNPADPSCAD